MFLSAIKNKRFLSDLELRGVFVSLYDQPRPKQARNSKKHTYWVLVE